MLSPMVGNAATALGYIAVSPSAALQVREIAEATGVPAPYLSKIVHRLSRKGLVRTRRGIGGGVQLSIDPAAVTLFELCETLEDPVLRPQCMLGLGECDDDDACPAHAFSRDVRNKQLAFLRSTTLLDVGRFDAERRTRGAPRRTPFGTAPTRGRPGGAKSIATTRSRRRG